MRKLILTSLFLLPIGLKATPEELEARFCPQLEQAAGSNYTASGAPNLNCIQTRGIKYRLNSCSASSSDIRINLSANIEKEKTFTVGRLINIGGIGQFGGIRECAFTTEPVYTAPPVPLKLNIECTFTNEFKWFCGYQFVEGMNGYRQAQIMESFQNYIEENY